MVGEMLQGSATAAGIGLTAAEWMTAVWVGAAIVLSVATSDAAEPCAPMIARIVSLQGQVEIKRGEAGAWMAAALDDQLCIGDSIRVGAWARAAIALANESVLSINQLTTLRVDAPAESGRSLLDLLFGEVHFFSHRPRSLEIDTPIASAGAEGTEFLMRVMPDRTEVLMFEGRVRLATPEGELLLASGEAGIATRGAAPRPEIVARPRDAVAWSLYYPPILAPLAEHRPPPEGLPQGLQTAIERVAANDYAGAIAALDAVPQAARDARYYTYRAGVLLNVGRVDEAAQAINQALTLDPEAADALAQRAVIAVVQNRRAHALADAKRAVELNPDSAPARIALSYAQQASFDLEGARATLREASDRTPDNALVWARLAEIELSFGNLGAAQTAADRAVALAPDLARTQMVLGFAALTRIDISQARAAFVRAIELDSAEPLARLGLGLAKIRGGHLDAGGRELEIAVALDPSNSLLRSYLGKAYFEERRAPLDAQQYEIAKHLDPNDPTPWFYDAIRLQTENRPVEALHELEKSIELNDNRAVYRSRLLLDQDRATRGVSLARIYDDLGFQQLGADEATRSLSLDPANSAAHRFLSDLYVGKPRLEVARASELLQAQLRQPLGRNPIQPSLAFTDLNILRPSGPGTISLGDFTPLFDRDGFQISGTGLVGSEDTLADEIVATGQLGRTALSLGQFHYQTDGFRPNNDLNHNIFDVFGQVAVTEALSLQAEYRYRDTDQGDRRLSFDPDIFAPKQRKNVEQHVIRGGGRLRLSPGADVVVSGAITDRDETDSNRIDIPAFAIFPAHSVSSDNRDNADGRQGEIQYTADFGRLDLVVGGGLYNVHSRFKFVDEDSPCVPILEPCQNVTHESSNSDGHNVYAYSNTRIVESIVLTLGLGWDQFEQDQFEISTVSPKLGVQWSPTSWLELRAAAFRSVKRSIVVNQTIEPTQIAGFTQFFDDADGTKSDTLALGATIRPRSDLTLSVEAERRRTSPPFFEDFGEHANVEVHHQDEALLRGFLGWTLNDRMVLSANPLFDQFDQTEKDAGGDPTRITTAAIPVSLSYFHPTGAFASLGTTWLRQQVRRPGEQGGLEGTDSGFLVDAAIGYRFPRRRGLMTFEVGNLLDKKLSFQDDSFRTSELPNPWFVPERTFAIRLTLSL
jgi:tetratricopeptide (TPR) repeat protein